MTYEERKIELIRKGLTIQGLADEYTRKTRRPCRREEMSQCLRGVRIYPPLREFLAQKLDKTEEQLFGSSNANTKRAA